MKTKRTANLMAAVAATILSSGLAVGAQTPAPAARVPAARAVRTEQPKKALAFQTERTDSWLCNYVSPFFCSNLFPTLGGSGSSSTPSPAGQVPDRSRR